MMKFSVNIEFWPLAIFIVGPIISILLIILFSYIIQKICPKLYICISGNRT